MKRARRTDGNQQQVVAALQQAGFHVTDLSAVGGGVPDLLCTRASQALLVEIKNPKGRNRFTPAQVDYYAAVRCPVFVIRSINDVVLLINGQLGPINQENPGINGRKNPQKPSSVHG